MFPRGRARASSPSGAPLEKPPALRVSLLSSLSAMAERPGGSRTHPVWSTAAHPPRRWSRLVGNDLSIGVPTVCTCVLVRTCARDSGMRRHRNIHLVYRYNPAALRWILFFRRRARGPFLKEVRALRANRKSNTLSPIFSKSLIQTSEYLMMIMVDGFL